LMRLAREAFSPLGLLLVILGAIWLARGRLSWVLRSWLLADLAFLVLIPDTLAQNYYYLLLLVPPGSGLAAMALARLHEARRLRFVVPILLVFVAADALRCACC
jgi:hypothetical protein